MIEAIVLALLGLVVVGILMTLAGFVLFSRKASHDPYANPHGWEEW